MSTDEESKKPAEKPAKVQVRDLKPTRDAKGGADGRKREASFLLDDDDHTASPNKQRDGA